MPEVLETPASETPGKETPDTRRVNAMFDKVLRDLSLLSPRRLWRRQRSKRRC